VVGLLLPAPGRAEELRRPGPRPGCGRTGAGLRDRPLCGAGALRQGCGPPVRAAARGRGAERRHGAEQDPTGRRGDGAAALHPAALHPNRNAARCGAGVRPRGGRARWWLRAQPAPGGGAPLRSGRGQGHHRRWRPPPLRLRPQRPGDRDRGVPAGARLSRGGRGHAGDGAGRWRGRAVAAAA
jgi:hypothetical protein